jgi:hypothetical protein
LANDPAFLFEAMKGGEKRPWLDLKRSARQLVNAVRDRDTMHGLEIERSENQQIQCPFE